MAISDYVVVTGTTGALATFQLDVESYLDQGYTPLGGMQVSGTDVYQAVARESSPIAGIYPIIAVVTGATGSFKIATAQLHNFNVGFKFVVRGSTGNDGIYTVKAPGATLDGSDTVIPVVEVVASAVADGDVIGTT